MLSDGKVMAHGIITNILRAITQQLAIAINGIKVQFGFRDTKYAKVIKPVGTWIIATVGTKGLGRFLIHRHKYTRR